MERFSYPIKRENFFFPAYRNLIIPLHFSLLPFLSLSLLVRRKEEEER